MGLQILVACSNQESQRTVGDNLAKVDPLAGYFVDGDLLVGLPPLSRNRGGEQHFQEVVDSLEQEHMEPTLRHEPAASFSPGDHPSDDKHGERDRKEVDDKIEGQFG